MTCGVPAVCKNHVALSQHVAAWRRKCKRRRELAKSLGNPIAASHFWPQRRRGKNTLTYWPVIWLRSRRQFFSTSGFDWHAKPEMGAIFRSDFWSGFQSYSWLIDLLPHNRGAGAERGEVALKADPSAHRRKTIMARKDALLAASRATGRQARLASQEARGRFDHHPGFHDRRRGRRGQRRRHKRAQHAAGRPGKPGAGPGRACHRSDSPGTLWYVRSLRSADSDRATEGLPFTLVCVRASGCRNSCRGTPTATTRTGNRPSSWRGACGIAN